MQVEVNQTLEQHQLARCLLVLNPRIEILIDYLAVANEDHVRYISPQQAVKSRLLLAIIALFRETVYQIEDKRVHLKLEQVSGYAQYRYIVPILIIPSVILTV